MNFQAVDAASGNLVQMPGTFTEVGGVQYTPQRKAKAICKIRDDMGVSHNVHIHQGNGQLPEMAQFNQRHQFNISTFQGSYKNKPYTGYSGFWNNEAQVAQPPQQEQAQTQEPPARGNTEMVITRLAVLKAVIPATEIPLDYIRPYLEASLLWAISGDWKLTMPGREEATAGASKPEDDIPF